MRRTLHTWFVLVLVAGGLSWLAGSPRTDWPTTDTGRMRAIDPSGIGARFDATLLAQPNRAPIRLVAPYRVEVGVAAVQLTTSGTVNGGVVVKCICAGQTVYIGVASSVTTSTGYPMSDGETLTLEITNANALYGIASAAAQSVAVLPFSRF